jgi:hypothetical protein
MQHINGMTCLCLKIKSNPRCYLYWHFNCSNSNWAYNHLGCAPYSFPDWHQRTRIDLIWERGRVISQSVTYANTSSIESNWILFPTYFGIFKHTYRRLIFRKVIYTKLNVLCSLEQMDYIPIHIYIIINLVYIHNRGARGSVVGWTTMLQDGRSRVWFLMSSLDFSVDLNLPAALSP